MTTDNNNNGDDAGSASRDAFIYRMHDAIDSAVKSLGKAVVSVNGVAIAKFISEEDYVAVAAKSRSETDTPPLKLVEDSRTTAAILQFPRKGKE